MYSNYLGSASLFLLKFSCYGELLPFVITCVVACGCIICMFTTQYVVNVTKASSGITQLSILSNIDIPSITKYP